jgi:uncharacterized membrane protein
MTTIAMTALSTSHLVVDHWRGPGPWWPVFPVAWFLLVAGAITAAVLVARRNRSLAGARAGETRLAERFAAGEITEEEYRQRRSVLRERAGS